MYNRDFGKISGLRERVDDWTERLSCDKSFPWVGLGLIEDLQAMARYMDGERTDPASPDDIGTVLDGGSSIDHMIVDEGDERITAELADAPVEYDL